MISFLQVSPSNPVCLSSTLCMPHAPSMTPSIWSASIISWGVQIKKLLIMQFSLSCITSSHLGPNIPQTLFSNILMLCSSLHTRDKFLQPYKTKSKIVLHTLIFTILHSKCEHKRFWIQCLQPICMFNMLFISPWMLFWLVSVIHKHLNFPTFSKNLLVTYKMWICSASCSQHISIHLVLSITIPRPTSLLVSNRVSVTFFLVFMFLPSKHHQHRPKSEVSNPSKVGKQWQYSTSLFQNPC